jgi:hypothetical protein
LTQTTTPSGPSSNPLKKSAISDSEALKGSPRSLTTLLRFLKTHKQTKQNKIKKNITEVQEILLGLKLHKEALETKSSKARNPGVRRCIGCPEALKIVCLFPGLQ